MEVVPPGPPRETIQHNVANFEVNVDIHEAAGLDDQYLNGALSLREH